MYEDLYTNQSTVHTAYIREMFEQAGISMSSPCKPNYYEAIPQVLGSFNHHTFKPDQFVPSIRHKQLQQNPFQTYVKLKRKRFGQIILDEQAEKISPRYTENALPFSESDTKSVEPARTRTNPFFRRYHRSPDPEFCSKFKSTSDFEEYTSYQLDKSSILLQDYLARLSKSSNEPKPKLPSVANKRLQPNLPINQQNLVQQIKHSPQQRNSHLSSPQRFQVYKRRTLSNRFGQNRKQTAQQISPRSISTAAYYASRNKFNCTLKKV